jgi:DNA end-binding protein Ku
VVKRHEEEHEAGEGAATNVVDFMSLLQQSIERNKRTPAKKKATEASSKAAKKPARKAAKASAKKSAAKTARRKSA